MTPAEDQKSARIHRVGEFPRPTPLGEFNVISYSYEKGYAFALCRGSLPVDNLLVRIQSPCLFGEAFLVNSCDCGDQLRLSLKIGAAADSFLLVYLTDQEGRGHGLLPKIRGVETEVRRQVDMIEAFDMLGYKHDLRDYQIAADVIRDINGDRPIRLLTNNPKKIDGLKAHGVAAERVALQIESPNKECDRYLATKKKKMGHLLTDLD